ncbi:class I SAM-dependent methyltransferase [Salirhabdus salicampi]|uniref:class I SAM-dependent methyltransferase n=1 Tax=Salirhabdus salicampi TaxID=476102 RepID=UPI0020C579E2|nr:class I SAM-dependent methyltransferase [Salirhabdus salicampi]MCP8617121.1 class I SAM-dependent methyltransferase [Salirhabdus salicampi]
MDHQNVEKLYEWIDNSTKMIEEQFQLTYLESIVEFGELLLREELSEDVNDDVDVKVKSQLNKVDISKFEKEEIRKALQLAILKGMKGSTQQHHFITPDSVAMLMGYLVQKIYDKDEELHIFDPACGSGNLLTGVLNQLPHENVLAYGSEVDTTLLQLAYTNANLQQTNIQFFHQDSLRPFLLAPVDVVVSDLPVGYYPDDVQAQSYQLRAKEGHSYAHHLFIEQSLNYMKKGAHGLFLVPNFMFDSDQSDQLHQFIQEHAHVVGVLQLPETMFKSEKHGKSIFVIQKKGPNTKPPKKALLAKLPSFKDIKAMDKVLTDIHLWFERDRK